MKKRISYLAVTSTGLEFIKKLLKVACALAGCTYLVYGTIIVIFFIQAIPAHRAIVVG